MPGAELSLERFAHALYDPAVHAAGISGNALYIGAKGGHSRNMQDGRIEQIWKPLSALDEWVAKTGSFTDILPHNLNYTIALRSRADAKLNYVAGTTCFWVDIDDAKYGIWSQTVLPRLKGPLYPNIAVDSGWGVHLYWLLSSMRDFMPIGEDGVRHQDADRIREFEKYNRILAWLVCGDMQSSSAAHLLRLPGSSNCKTEPYLQCRAELLDEVRYSWADITDTLGSIAGKCLRVECKDKRLDTLRAILEPPKRQSLSSINLGEGPKLDISAEEAYARLVEKADGCPVLKDILRPPYIVSYMAWFAIACAIRKLVPPAVGADLFCKISLPGNTNSQPEREIENKYSEAEGYMPSGCAKLGDCYSSCPRAQKGQCGNVITYLRRVLSCAQPPYRNL